MKNPKKTVTPEVIETPTEVATTPALPNMLTDGHSEADTAALFFKMYYQKVQLGTKDMSARQLRRVILCAVGKPWEAGQIKPANEAEDNLVYIMRNMMIQSLIMQDEYNKMIAKPDETIIPESDIVVEKTEVK